MKKDIHPKYHDQAKVICACGNEFTTGSTMEEIKTELCHMCHPYFTGTQKLVDSARRVEKFQAKLEKKAKVGTVRKGKKVKNAARAAKKKETAQKDEK